MAKVWLSAAGKVLVNADGDVYLTDHCPCDCPSSCTGCPVAITVAIFGVVGDTCSQCSILGGGIACTDLTGALLLATGCVWSVTGAGGVVYDIQCTAGFWYLTIYQAAQHPYGTPCAQWRQPSSCCPPLDDQWVWVGGCCDGSGATVETS